MHSDVFLLLIHFSPQRCTNTTFRTGTTTANSRHIDIRHVYQSFGKPYADAIIEFHVLTGSDQTGKFSGKSTKDCFNVFLDYTPAVLDLFSLLGCDKSAPADIVIRGLQQFMMNLYCRRRPETVTTILSLRYHLFSKLQKPAQDLPPTETALYQKIRRKHFHMYDEVLWKYVQII